MHTVVLSSLGMYRSSQLSVHRSLPLSLLLGALLSVANVYAQNSEQSVSDDTTAADVGSNPDNFESDQGLLFVQQQMVAKALKYARELDFELAQRMLEDASRVREPQELIEAAREKIAGIRVLRAEELRLATVLAVDAGDFKRAEHSLIELIALGGADSTVNQLRRRMEEARAYGGFRPGQVIRDQFLDQGHWTPDSVVILAGSFIMGSSATEKGRKDNEGPQHRVTFPRGFAMGLHEVTVSEFRDFVDQARYRTDAERTRSSTIYNQRSGRLTTA